MKVFKFGGASVKDAQGFLNVENIVNHFRNDKLAIVVSATGKTTNALEEVLKSYFQQDGHTAQLVESVKQNHLNIIKGLGIEGNAAVNDLNDLFVEIDWVIEETPKDDYDYIYDQVVSIGELVSSKILYYTLQAKGHKVAWLDIRDVLYTDEIHREAKVLWHLSTDKINEKVHSLLKENDIVVTQGFIGSTQENHTTTLGREGSDYTAAILSYCCNAESMHIWKDVDGVLTGDPKKLDNTLKIDKLSYSEAIEMTYFGAKVIHPKTIKPLQNKNIPLFVRPFGDVTKAGTKISAIGEPYYPPIVVVESGQALLNISVNDFSFVAEHHLSDIFKTIADLRLKVNMMRNTAISFTICILYDEQKVNQLMASLSKNFQVELEKDLELITIRHYSEDVLTEMKRSRITLFEERLKDTIQMVVKNIPAIKRKEQEQN